MQDLESLKGIDFDLILRNSVLEDISALSNLTTITVGAFISGTSISSFDSLSSLESLSALYLLDNDQLVSMEGSSQVDPLSINQ